MGRKGTLSPLCCAFGDLLEHEPIALYDMKPDDVRAVYTFCQNCAREVNFELSTLLSTGSLSAERFQEWTHSRIPVVEHKPMGFLSAFKEQHDSWHIGNLPVTNFDLVKSFCSLAIVLLGTKSAIDGDSREALPGQLLDTLNSLGCSVTFAKFITTVYSSSTQIASSFEHNSFTMLQQLLVSSQDLMCLVIQSASSPEPFITKQANEPLNVLQLFFQASTCSVDHRFHEQWQTLLDQLLTSIISLISSSRLSSGFISSVIEGQVIENSIKAVLLEISTSNGKSVLSKYADALHILRVLTLLFSKIEQTGEIFANIFAENSGLVTIIVMLQKLEVLQSEEEYKTATDTMIKLIDMIPLLAAKCTEEAILLDHVKALGDFLFKTKVVLIQEHVLAAIMDLSASSENADVIIKSGLLNEVVGRYLSLPRELSPFVMHLIGGVCRAAPESLQQLLTDIATVILDTDVSIEYLHLLHGVIADAFAKERPSVQACCIKCFATKVLRSITNSAALANATNSDNKIRRKEKTLSEREQSARGSTTQKSDSAQITGSLGRINDLDKIGSGSENQVASSNLSTATARGQDKPMEDVSDHSESANVSQRTTDDKMHDLQQITSSETNMTFHVTEERNQPLVSLCNAGTVETETIAKMSVLISIENLLVGDFSKFSGFDYAIDTTGVSVLLDTSITCENERVIKNITELIFNLLCFTVSCNDASLLVELFVNERHGIELILGETVRQYQESAPQKPFTLSLDRTFTELITRTCTKIATTLNLTAKVFTSPSAELSSSGKMVFVSNGGIEFLKPLTFFSKILSFISLHERTDSDFDFVPSLLSVQSAHITLLKSLVSHSVIGRKAVLSSCAFETVVFPFISSKRVDDRELVAHHELRSFLACFPSACACDDRFNQIIDELFSAATQSEACLRDSVKEKVAGCATAPIVYPQPIYYLLEALVTSITDGAYSTGSSNSIANTENSLHCSSDQQFTFCTSLYFHAFANVLSRVERYCDLHEESCIKLSEGRITEICISVLRRSIIERWNAILPLKTQTDMPQVTVDKLERCKDNCNALIERLIAIITKIGSLRITPEETKVLFSLFALINPEDKEMTMRLYILLGTLGTKAEFFPSLLFDKTENSAAALSFTVDSPFPRNEFSISLWFRVDGESNAPLLSLGLRGSTDTQEVPFIQLQIVSGALSYQIDGSEELVSLQRELLTLDHFHHVAVTQERKQKSFTSRIFIDGQQRHAFVMQSQLISKQQESQCVDVVLGACHWKPQKMSSARFYVGSTCVFSKALSAKEVVELCSFGPTDPLDRKTMITPRSFLTGAQFHELGQEQFGLSSKTGWSEVTFFSMCPSSFELSSFSPTRYASSAPFLHELPPRTHSANNEVADLPPYSAMPSSQQQENLPANDMEDNRTREATASVSLPSTTPFRADALDVPSASVPRQTDLGQRKPQLAELEKEVAELFAFCDKPLERSSQSPQQQEAYQAGLHAKSKRSSSTSFIVVVHTANESARTVRSNAVRGCYPIVPFPITTALTAIGGLTPLIYALGKVFETGETTAALERRAEEPSTAYDHYFHETASALFPSFLGKKFASGSKTVTPSGSLNQTNEDIIAWITAKRTAEYAPRRRSEIAVEFDCMFRLICLGTLMNSQLLEQFTSESIAELLYLLLSQLSSMTPPNVVGSTFLLATGPAPLLRRNYFESMFDNRPLELTLNTIGDFALQACAAGGGEPLSEPAVTETDVQRTEQSDDAMKRLCFAGSWSEKALLLFPAAAKVMLFRLDWWLRAEDAVATKLGFTLCNGLISCGASEHSREAFNVKMLRLAGELDAPKKIYVPVQSVLCSSSAARSRFPIVHLVITHAKLTASLPASCYPFSFEHPLFDSCAAELSTDDSRRLKYAARIFKLIEGILQLSITKEDYLQLQEVVFGMTTHAPSTAEEQRMPARPSEPLMREDDYFPPSLFTNLMCIELLDRFIDFDQYIASEKTGFIGTLMRKTSKMAAAFPKYLRQDVPFPLYLFHQTPFAIFTVALRSFVVQSYRVKLTKECAELAAALLSQTVAEHPCCDFVLYQLMLVVVKPRAPAPPNDYRDFVEIFTFFDKKTEITNHQFLTPIMASIAGMLERSGALTDEELSLAKNVLTFVSGLWNTSDVNKRILADAENGEYGFISELLRITLGKRMACARGALETAYNFAADIATRVFQEGLKTLNAFGDLFEVLVRHEANLGNESKFLHSLFSQLFDYVLTEVKKTERRALISTSGELKELTPLGRNIRTWLRRTAKLYLESKNCIGAWQTTFVRTLRSRELGTRLLAFVHQMAMDFSACKVDAAVGTDLAVCKIVLATELLGEESRGEFVLLLTDDEIESALSVRNVGCYLLTKMLTESFTMLHTGEAGLREFLVRLITLAIEKHSEVLKQSLLPNQLLYDICIMRYPFSDALELSQAKDHDRALHAPSSRTLAGSQTLHGVPESRPAAQEMRQDAARAAEKGNSLFEPFSLSDNRSGTMVARKDNASQAESADQTGFIRESACNANEAHTALELRREGGKREQGSPVKEDCAEMPPALSTPKLTRLLEDTPIVDDYIQHMPQVNSNGQPASQHPSQSVTDATRTVRHQKQSEGARSQAQNWSMSLPRRQKIAGTSGQKSAVQRPDSRTLYCQAESGPRAFVTAQNIPEELDQCLSYLAVHKELIADQFPTRYVQDADTQLAAFLSSDGKMRRTLLSTAHSLLVQAKIAPHAAAPPSAPPRSGSTPHASGTVSPKERFILELDTLRANFMTDKEARSLAYYIHVMNGARYAVDRWLKRTRPLFAGTGVWGLQVSREFVKWKQDQTVCPRKFYCRMRPNREFFDLFPSARRQADGVSAGTEDVSARYERWVASRVPFASTCDRRAYLPFGRLTTSAFQPCDWICNPVEPCLLLHENVLKQLVAASKVAPAAPQEPREDAPVCTNASLVYGMEQAYGVLIQQGGSISFIFNYGVYDGVLNEMDDEKYRARGVECAHSKVHRRQLIYHDTRQSKTVSFSLADVAAAYDRRFLQLELGTEVYLKRGKSYLFVFESVQEAARARKLFGSVPDATHVVAPSGALLPVRLKDVQRLWVDGDLSNYEYLMCLNELSGRTFHDLAQYPVVPWVLADYRSAALDLERAGAFRDLRKPVGALDPARAEVFAERYAQLSALERETGEAPFHYGTHYSSSGTILYFLVRLESFSRMAADFQEGHFDAPDRIFSSVEFAWETASRESTAQIMELVPEFYTVPHFLYNHNQFNFGVATKLDGTTHGVSDVRLPPWAHGSPHCFVEGCAAALESGYASALLGDWIDLIFGYKQRGREAQEALNVFHPLSYCGAVALDDIADISKRKTVFGIINNFGQTPRQLFTAPHPQRGRTPAERPFAAVEQALIAKGELETVQEFFSKRSRQRTLAPPTERLARASPATPTASAAPFSPKHVATSVKGGFTVWDLPHKLVVNSVKAIGALQSPVTSLLVIQAKKQKEPRIVANSRHAIRLPPDYDKSVVYGEPWVRPGNLAICDESGKCIKQLELAQQTASNGPQDSFFRDSTSLLCRHNDFQAHTVRSKKGGKKHLGQTWGASQNDGDSCDEGSIAGTGRAEVFYSNLPFASGQRALSSTICAKGSTVCSLCLSPVDDTSGRPATVTLYAGLRSGAVIAAELDLAQLEFVSRAFLCSGTAPVTALCASPRYGMLISGDASGKVVFWDTRSRTAIHALNCFRDNPVVSVVQDAATGDVAVVSASAVELFSVNGEYVGKTELDVFAPSVQYNLDTMLDYLEKPRAPFTCCMFVPQARGTFSLRAHAFVAGHLDGTISFWQVEQSAQGKKQQQNMPFVDDVKEDGNSCSTRAIGEAVACKVQPSDTPFAAERKMQTYSISNKANTCALYAIVDRTFELAKIFETTEPFSML